MNLETIAFSRLLNSEHLSLVQKLAATLRKHIAALPELKALCDKLDTLIAAELKTYEVLKTSAFTAEKAEADRIRDNAARQLAHYVQSYEFSDDENVLAAAFRLKELLKDVPAMVVEAGERETVQLNNLVARLNEEPFATALKTLNATPLAEKIAEKNAAYDAVSTQQTETDSAKDSGNVNAARKPVDAELHKMYRVIESRFDLDTADSDVKTCVDEMNYDIREAETKMKQRLTISKKKTAE